jgi:hypothetical protein
MWWSYKNILRTLKVLILLIMIVVIYEKIQSFYQIEKSFALFTETFSSGNIKLFLFAVLLMPLNWLIEILKWKQLLKLDLPISFTQSLKSVMGGLSIGFATPARIGEFGGRVLFLPNNKKVDGIYLSALGGLAQSLFTILVPLFFLRFYSGKAQSYFTFPSITALSFLLALLLFCYFNFERVIAFVRTHYQHTFLSNYLIQENLIPNFSHKLMILALSGFRYSIYVLQFFLLFEFIGIDQTPFSIISAITILLLFQSISFIAPFMDVAARGGMALLIFEHFDDLTVSIYMVPVLLWTINLLFPAVLGYYFIWQLKSENAS